MFAGSVVHNTHSKLAVLSLMNYRFTKNKILKFKVTTCKNRKHFDLFIFFNQNIFTLYQPYFNVHTELWFLFQCLTMDQVKVFKYLIQHYRRLVHRMKSNKVTREDFH